MRLLRRRSPQPGTVWDGPAAICDDASVDHRHGAYALTDDGKHLRQPPLRLVTVVAADGSHHYEVAAAGDAPLRYAEKFEPRQGETVELEPEPLQGSLEVDA